MIEYVLELVKKEVFIKTGSSKWVTHKDRGYMEMVELIEIGDGTSTMV